MRRRGSLNLASKGFANERPLRRAAIVLSLVGLVLLGVNGFLYGRYQAASVEVRGELRTTEGGIEEELAAVQELEASLSRLDLEAQNEQVTFLNERIAERTFPWSRLFDHLTEVLPPEVRLSSLNPTSESRARGRRRGRGDGSVRLSITGEAKTDEALVALVDGLFSHPSFTDPHLVQESRETGTVHFLLDARYRPRPPGAPAASAPEVAETVTGPPEEAASAAASAPEVAEAVTGPPEEAASAAASEEALPPPASPSVASAAGETVLSPSAAPKPAETPPSTAGLKPVAEATMARPEEEPVASPVRPARSDGGDVRGSARPRPLPSGSGGAVVTPRAATTARPPAAPAAPSPSPATPSTGLRPPSSGNGGPAMPLPSNASSPPRLRGGG